MKKQHEVSLLASMPIYIANKFLYTQIESGLQDLSTNSLKVKNLLFLLVVGQFDGTEGINKMQIVKI